MHPVVFVRYRDYSCDDRRGATFAQAVLERHRRDDTDLFEIGKNVEQFLFAPMPVASNFGGARPSRVRSGFGETFDNVAVNSFEDN